jgi:hypothetical protein
MGKIADALKKLIENSDDLSTLPQLVAQVETIEASEENYQLRISKLQEVNKSYLAQIPIPGQEPPKKEDEPKEATLDDAKNYLIEALGGKE